jgi:hypothetical protein
MASGNPVAARGGVVRAPGWDIVVPALAAAHLAVLFLVPTAPSIAVGIWWNANTIAHLFIHKPFFRRRWANVLFAAHLSVLVGFPQSLWRDRHLAHHAGVRARMRVSGELIGQTTLVALLWAALAALAPAFFLSVYVPGYLGGLTLCALHGYFEHAGGTTSYYGRLYNVLFFNDGYHVEHHANPGLHWTRLPERREAVVRASACPAPLRWIEALSLEGLERLVLKSPVLQRFVLRAHARAFRELGGLLRSVDRVAIVGGGLFPRTALILQRLLPEARLTIVDANQANLDRARAFLGPTTIDFVHARYPRVDAGSYDLVVIPLSFEGDRDAIYTRPPAAAVIVHDWIWRSRGVSQRVSWTLLKRINLVRR